MKTNSMKALRKSVFLFLSATFLILWLPISRLQPFGSRPVPGLLLPTIFHNASAKPIEIQNQTTNLFPDPLSSQHAYVFYATEPEYACSALVNIDRLRNKFNSTYRIIVIAKPSIESKFLTKFVSYNVTVLPYEPPPIPAEYPYYQDVLLKLVSFRLHQYIPSLERILVLDSDQLIIQSLDHLFSLPSVDLAAPRVYWGDDAAQFTSAMMLIKLSDRIWERVDAGIGSVNNYKFDMDIVNDVFRNFTLILPGDYCTLNSHLEDNWLPAWYEGNEWASRKNDEDYEQTEVKLEGQKQDLFPPEQDIAKRKRAISPIMNQEKRSNHRLENTVEEEPPEPSHKSEKEQQAIKEFGTAVEEQNQRLHIEGTYEIGPTQLDIPVVAQDQSEETRKAKETSELLSRKHKLMGPLQKIYDEEVKVLHFTAVGKPWNVSEDRVRIQKPDAHPLLAEHFRIWRMKAKEVCPGFEEISV